MISEDDLIPDHEIQEKVNKGIPISLAIRVHFYGRHLTNQLMLAIGVLQRFQTI